MADDSKALNIQIVIDLLGQGKTQEAAAALEQLKLKAGEAGERGAEGAHKMELGHRQLAEIVQRLAGTDFPELGHAISGLAFGGTVVGSIFAVVGLIEMLRGAVENYQEKLHEIEVDGAKAVFLPGIEKKLQTLGDVVDAMDSYQRALDRQKTDEHSVTAELAEQLTLHAAIRAATQSQTEAEHTLALAKLEQDKALGNITPIEATIKKGEIDKQFARDKAKAARDDIFQQASDEKAASEQAAAKQAELDNKYQAALDAQAKEKNRQAGINDQFNALNDKDPNAAAARVTSEGKTPDEWRAKIADLQKQLTAAQQNTEVDSSVFQASIQRYITNAERYLQASITVEQFEKLQREKTTIAGNDPLKALDAAVNQTLEEAKKNQQAILDGQKKSTELLSEYYAALDARNASLKANIAAIDSDTHKQLGQDAGVGPNGSVQDRASQQQNILKASYEAAVIAAGEEAKKNLREGRVSESLNPVAFRANQQKIDAENGISQSDQDFVKALADIVTGHSNTMQQAAEAIAKLKDSPDALLKVVGQLVSLMEKNDSRVAGFEQRLDNLTANHSFPNRGQ